MSNKYRVIGVLSASVTLGKYEASSPEDAIKMAENDGRANWNPCLCHHCARELDLGDVYETVAEVIED